MFNNIFNNLKDKLLQVKKVLKGRQALAILLLLIVVFALPLTVYLVKQRQDIRSKAAGGAVKVVLSPQGGNYKLGGGDIPIDIYIQSDDSSGREQITGADITVTYDNSLAFFSFVKDPAATLSEVVVNQNLGPGIFRYVAVNTGGALLPLNSIKLGRLTLKVNSPDSKDVTISVSNSKVVALTQALELSSSSDPITLTINPTSSPSPSPSASPSLASCTAFSPQGLTPAEVKNGVQVYRTASYNDAGTKYLNATYSPSGATFTPSSTPTLEIGQVQGTNQLYANIPVNNDTTANVEYTVSATVSSSNTVDCPSFIIRVPKKPGDTTCPYTSTQVKFKTSGSSLWLSSGVTVALGGSVTVAGFHNVPSTLANDVILSFVGPNDEDGSLEQNTAFTPSQAGSYTFTATTTGKSGGNCTGSSTFAVTATSSPSPSPSASPATISGVFSTLSPNCITPGYEGNGLSVIWNGSGIAFVDIDTSAGNFTGTYYHSNGFINNGSAYKITAPKDTADNLFGAYLDGCTPGFSCPTGTLSFNPSTSYVFRLFDGTNHSAAARYTTPPACAQASPSPSPSPTAVRGDVDANGCLSANDANLIWQMIQGILPKQRAAILYDNDFTRAVDMRDYTTWWNIYNTDTAHHCS